MMENTAILTTPANLEKRKRRSGLKRAAPNELPKFRLTARDTAIILAVYHYRALTAPQIATLCFAASNGQVNARCKHRLRMLYHLGYLSREEQPSRLSEGRRPYIYRLDTAGRKVLALEFGEDLESAPKGHISPIFQEHLLATNDIRIAITLTCHKHPQWEILSWLDDKSLKSPQMKDRVILRGEHGGKLQAAVVPDAYIRLDAQEDIYNFFLEVDRGTVTGEASEWGRRDWGRKVKAYLEYYRSGLYQKRYGTSDMRVLTVTTGETRLANLKKITEQAGGKARFWFSTFARLKDSDILTDPVWSVASRKETAALIANITATVYEYQPKSSAPKKPSAPGAPS